MLLGCALVIKFYRRQSMDSFLSDALTYCQARWPLGAAAVWMHVYPLMHAASAQPTATGGQGLPAFSWCH